MSSPAGSIRSGLSARVAEECLSSWSVAAASAGVSGNDAFMVHRGRSITAAMKSVVECAETARSQLRTTRSCLHAAIDTRCDELGAIIDSAEAVKVASLECELVSVDAALECWRTETRFVREAVSSLTDNEIEMQHVSLSSRLDGMEAQLQAVPTALTEPPQIALSFDTPAIMSWIARLGCVLAPLRVTLASLGVPIVPRNVLAGSMLICHLPLGTQHSTQSPEEMHASLGLLTQAIQFVATLEVPGSETQSLRVAVATHAATCRLVVSLDIPCMIPFADGTCVRLKSVSVAGQSSPDFTSFCIPVFRGIRTPLLLEHDHVDCEAPCCISRDGSLYYPYQDGMRVFDADGAPCHWLPIDSRGQFCYVECCAFVEGGAPSLLLACKTPTSSFELVCVDPTTCDIRWVSVVLENHSDYRMRGDGLYQRHKSDRYASACLTLLPALGAVVSMYGDVFFVHRLSDGYHVGTLRVPGLRRFMASDPATGVVYTSMRCENEERRVNNLYAVHAWSCATDGAGISVNDLGPVPAAGTRERARPLVVMPPAPGKTVSHLVVGVLGSSELIVLSLPDFALVHTHSMEGITVKAMAADPWGRALAVCDADVEATIHVVAWPLPGMLPLD